MEFFELMAEGGHEQVVLWSEPSLGYRGVIAIHDTTLGPALGGTRFWNYASGDDAIVDALRLARGMTFKASVAGLLLGGGKSVIWGDRKTTNREMIFRAHGRAVESLHGRYITAEDVGTSPADMEFVAMETEHVVGLPGRSGDPSPVTAHGVYCGIKACCEARYGSDALEGRHVVVQGLGHVGLALCEDLSEAGVRLTVTDIDSARVAGAVERFGAEAVAPDAVFDVAADVFAPCALGAVINDETLPRLKFDIVAGSANNQLGREHVHGPALHEAGILYAPDFVINAGGLINVYGEMNGWTAERSMRKASDIHGTLLEVFKLAEADGVPPSEAAHQIAERRLLESRHLQRTFLP